MSPDVFLERALMDPTTGLPNVPYFRLIHDWESRRARRYNQRVRTLRVTVSGGGEDVRQSLSWRLCRELRDSDLIASSGPQDYRILLTSPDAEHVDRLRGRIEQIIDAVNGRVGEGDALSVEMKVEEEKR